MTTTHGTAPRTLEPTATRRALLPYPETQEYLGGISRSSLRRLVANGELRAVSVGGRKLFPIAELDRYIADRLAAAGADN